ncbi:excisionase family protein [Pseudomonas sp. MIL19]|uniref:excisionase family protein n=1 Tax=Pseudomonas sp. MIL19 TaxID=2976979 RepID=UPI002364A248|nr:excisionase family protein [Pseudomonas sp. MIL19]MDD2162543.1 excisionase family protein [Pseudomonas sp. MIL19]
MTATAKQPTNNDTIPPPNIKQLFAIVPAKWVRQELLFPVFGISTEAARKYRASGQWHEGKHWDRDPANRVIYNREAIEKWMSGAL